MKDPSQLGSTLIVCCFNAAKCPEKSFSDFVGQKYKTTTHPPPYVRRTRDRSMYHTDTQLGKMIFEQKNTISRQVSQVSFFTSFKKKEAFYVRYTGVQHLPTTMPQARTGAPTYTTLLFICSSGKYIAFSIGGTCRFNRS